MNDSTTREPARDPQDLERLLVARENAGDVAGMTALFEPDAVIDIGGGTFLRGKEAIHEFFTKLQVTGFGPEKRKFELGEQRPALICGDLALTSTRGRPTNESYGAAIDIIASLLPGPLKVTFTSRFLGAPITLSGNRTTTCVTSPTAAIGLSASTGRS